MLPFATSPLLLAARCVYVRLKTCCRDGDIRAHWCQHQNIHTFCLCCGLYHYQFEKGLLGSNNPILLLVFRIGFEQPVNHEHCHVQYLTYRHHKSCSLIRRGCNLITYHFAWWAKKKLKNTLEVEKGIQARSRTRILQRSPNPQ